MQNSLLLCERGGAAGCFLFHFVRSASCAVEAASGPLVHGARLEAGLFRHERDAAVFQHEAGNAYLAVTFGAAEGVVVVA